MTNLNPETDAITPEQLAEMRAPRMVSEIEIRLRFLSSDKSAVTEVGNKLSDAAAILARNAGVALLGGSTRESTFSSLDYGVMMRPEDFFDLVLRERQKQEFTWGGLEHDLTHSEQDWVTILMGEVADAVRAVKECWGNRPYRSLPHELVSIAAVCYAWFEVLEIHRQDQGNRPKVKE